MSLLLKTHNIRSKGSFGELYYKGELIAYTVEREWQNNQRNISCIPQGTYKLEWTQSPKFGKRIALVNPDLNVSINGDTHRTHILIHAGNTVDDTRGCILLGTDWLSSSWGVANSRSAIEDFEHLICSNPDLRELTIVRL